MLKPCSGDFKELQRNAVLADKKPVLVLSLSVTARRPMADYLAVYSLALCKMQNALCFINSFFKKYLKYCVVNSCLIK